FQEQLLGLLVSDHLAQIGYGRESGGQRGRRRRDGRSRVETGAGDGALLRFAEEDEEDGDRGERHRDRDRRDDRSPAFTPRPRRGDVLQRLPYRLRIGTAGRRGVVEQLGEQRSQRPGRRGGRLLIDQRG